MYYKVNRNTTKETALSKLDNSSQITTMNCRLQFLSSKAADMEKNCYTFSDDFMVEFYEGTR